MAKLSELMDLVSTNELVKKFDKFVKDCKTGYGSFYVGISKDALDRLKAHKVDLDNGIYLWDQAASSDAARAVEKHFTDLGCEGGGGGGDDGDGDDH